MKRVTDFLRTYFEYFLQDKERIFSDEALGEYSASLDGLVNIAQKYSLPYDSQRYPHEAPEIVGILLDSLLRAADTISGLKQFVYLRDKAVEAVSSIAEHQVHLEAQLKCKGEISRRWSSVCEQFDHNEDIHSFLFGAQEIFEALEKTFRWKWKRNNNWNNH